MRSALMLKRIAFVIGLTLLLPAVSSAQIYAGATVGAGGAHVPFGSSVGGFRGELRLFGGYEFTSNIAAEVMTLDLGTPKNNPSTIGAFGVAAVGTLPVQRWRF